MDKVIIVWCESPSNKISLRVNSDGTPVQFDRSALPASVLQLNNVEAVFDVIKRQDGTQIAVPVDSIELLFGWKL